jgi:hypothetical protein
MGPGPLLPSSEQFVPRAHPSLRYIATLVLLAALVSSNLAFAQSASNFAGDYAGMLGPLHVKLHLTTSHDGTLSCTVDSPDQNMVGLACADVHVSGQSLSYTVPTVTRNVYRPTKRRCRIAHRRLEPGQSDPADAQPHHGSDWRERRTQRACPTYSQRRSEMGRLHL